MYHTIAINKEGYPPHLVQAVAQVNTDRDYRERILSGVRSFYDTASRHRAKEVY